MLTKGLGRGGAERLIVGAARLIDRERFDLDVAYLLPWKDAFAADVAATQIGTGRAGRGTTVTSRNRYHRPCAPTPPAPTMTTGSRSPSVAG